MLYLPKFKKLLGQSAEKLTDEEIIQIHDNVAEFAEIAFDMFVEKKSVEEKNKTC